MTWTPQPPFGTGGNVTGTISTVNADFGAKNFPNSPNTDGELSTFEYLQDLNNSNIGTEPASNAETT